MLRPFPLQDQVPPELKPYIPDFWWDMDKLHNLPLPTETMLTARLLWQLDLPWWEYEGKVFSVTPNEVRARPEKYADQYERTLATDLDYPLIVRKDDERVIIMDGLHRLLKASITGQKDVAVRVFESKYTQKIAMSVWKIGAVQAQDIQGDTTASRRIITEAMERADAEGVDILCFPECFLQGYTLNKEETEQRAFDAVSPEFKVILDALAGYKVTIILGLIEKDADGYYNTAAVIRMGKVLGIYRKVHLFERNFQPGETYPVFTVDGLKFGINICYDARFTEGASELAARGAQIIFYPLNNRLPSEKAVNSHDKHIPNLVVRAQESGCWVVSSDVIAQDDTHIGYGCTAIVSPTGTVAARVAELTNGMITVEVDSHSTRLELK